MIERILTSVAQSTSFRSDEFNIADDLEHKISNLSFDAVFWGGAILIVLLIVSALVRDHLPKLKAPLFVAVAFNVFVVTTILIGATIHLNNSSISNGPVHWHADFEIWACGQEVELRDPIGRLSNKIGTATLHEHNDKRIHLEGVVVVEEDASLGKFFHVIDGYIDDTRLQVPVNAITQGESATDLVFEKDTTGSANVTTQQQIIDEYLVVTQNDGTVLQFQDGQTCTDGTKSEVQTFVYEIGRNDDGSYETRIDEGKEKKVFYQRKLRDTSEFIINGESTVPDGNCLIFEFSPTKQETDKLCEQFIVRDTGRTVTNKDGTTRESLNDYVYGGVRSSGDNE